ncbi:glycosyltransferase family 1 protein [Ferrovibrio sp.]|uniref:glycosyltransferase family 4 protein n=1 Tax=Ferrovibrio sp. TaxID=1917215 RepID=UPI001B5DFD81|nr:glycosyltransferase family 1 protein [Ferrovibrio sp.]MBP7066637.1 glycosyltransferase family 1 protein [Ferrovibrio sp.]
MRILIVSDAWHPQVNGVVRTLTKTVESLSRQGHVIEVVGPGEFRRMPCPTYPEIELAILPYRALVRRIEAFAPEAIHIATEGPLGLAARRYCTRHNFAFTTAYHTKFPEYVEERAKVPLAWSYAFMRWFHNGSAGMMVATQSLADSLAARGFRNLRTWSRGVDTERFRPRDKALLDLPRPIHLYAGRVVVDKNIEAFLKLDLPGTKLVVGIGPQLEEYRARYPEAVFAGYLENGALAGYFAAADVFVFPSLTDTFGLVLLEALASGVPVAAYPVTGPLDVIGPHPEVGCLHDDLGEAIKGALGKSPQACRDLALRYSWEACSAQFLQNLTPMRPAVKQAA